MFSARCVSKLIDLLPSELVKAQPSFFVPLGVILLDYLLFFFQLPRSAVRSRFGRFWLENFWRTLFPWILREKRFLILESHYKGLETLSTEDETSDEEDSSETTELNYLLDLMRTKKWNSK